MNLKTIFPRTQMISTNTTSTATGAHPGWLKRIALSMLVGWTHQILMSLGNEEIIVSFYRLTTILENTGLVPPFVVSSDKNLKRILRQEGA